MPSTQILAHTKSADSTQALAFALAAELVSGDLIVLLGDLGAGKTCFTQGLAKGLGVTDRVTSPTFALVNHYEGRLRLHHLDVYRLAGADQIEDLDLYEMAEDGVTIIEWGHNVLSALDDSRLEITLTFDSSDPSSDTARQLEMTFMGECWSDRVVGLAQQLEPWL